MIYRGFHINPLTYQITHNGKPVFTAWHQLPLSLESAKRIIDLSCNAPRPVHIPQPITDDSCELENGFYESEAKINYDVKPFEE